MTKARLRSEVVFVPDSRPSQHAIDRHVLEEYDRGIRRTSSPPAEPTAATARLGEAQRTQASADK